MLRVALIFFLSGIFWLFVFSAQMGKGLKLFDIGNAHIVNSLPVNWVIEKLKRGYDSTLKNAQKETDIDSNSLDSVEDFASNQDDKL